MVQRLQQSEQAATEQVVARRQAEQALAEAQVRITQQGQAFQQRTRANGQVVDTRVLGKPDKWDGSDQQLSDDMTKAEISTTVLDNGSMSPEAEAWSGKLAKL